MDSTPDARTALVKLSFTLLLGFERRAVGRRNVESPTRFFVLVVGIGLKPAGSEHHPPFIH